MDLSQKILSDVIVFNKYAKFIPEMWRRETWKEICQRNADMHIKKFPYLREYIQEIYDKYVVTKLVLPSMRAVQFAGKPVEVNNSRIFNCCALPIDSLHAFSETMFLLLGGSGVGYSVQKHHIECLPVVAGPKQGKKKYLVADSIEGWADTIKALMKAFFENRSMPDFDYRDIRPKGARLITAGGKAPGPDPLRVCVENVKTVLWGAVGRKLTSLECHDIQCHIADAVLTGGIRRAAMINFFDHDDMDMVTCKSGNWWELNPQRGRANNSAVLHRDEIDYNQFQSLWKRIEESNAGEPGVYWTNDKDILSNPCFRGDMKLLTSEGYQRLDSLVGKEFSVATINYTHSKGKVWSNGVKPIVEIQFVDGERESVFCTPDHIFMLEGGQECKAKDLTGKRVMSSFPKQLGKYIVKDVVDAGEAEVFDFSEPEQHWGFINGVVAHNCVEATLRMYSFCNLTTINVTDVHNQELLNELAKAATFIGTLQASYTDFHYLRDIWRERTEEDALIGVSMTGIGSGAVLKLNLEEAALCVKEENKRVAALIGINVAARTTLNKPEGTASIVVGSSSGCHAWHNDYYIRSVRVGKNEALYHYMKGNFPELIEDCKFKPHIEAVMSFPQKAPDGSILRTESFLDLLERVKRLNQEWIAPGHNRGIQKHNVSCTISLKPDEWEQCGNWMWENRFQYNGISVLPYDGGTYVQAPFQDCSKEVYEGMMEYISNQGSFDLTKIVEEEDLTSHTAEAACAGGMCEIS